MKYTYDFEVQTMVTVFMNAISDIVVKRFNSNREAKDQIKTRLVYAPKQRVLNDILDKDQNLQLPVIACYIGGINRDTSRVYNKILGTYQTAGAGTVVNDKQPTPIDISLNLTVVTRYQADMDQILSHILPYINPYFTVSWRTPGRPDKEIRSKVFWDGNVSVNYPFDVNASQVAKVVADLSFTFKGWMFQYIPDQELGTIHTIHSFYNNEETGIPCEYLLDEEYQKSNNVTDYLKIKGVPPQPLTIEPYFAEIGSRQQFNVYGRGFTQITNVYLSGEPLKTVSTLYNPFSSFPKLSADNPSFSAVKINTTQWAYNKDNFLTFVMPSATTTGRIDLIVEGPVGYGKLTQSVRVNTYNPFLSGTPEYETFVPYQMPYLSGIQIRS